jgi:hypothetical protein
MMNDDCVVDDTETESFTVKGGAVIEWGVYTENVYRRAQVKVNSYYLRILYKINI